MKTYLVKAQGYGGGGPSANPFESLDLHEIKGVIEELLSSDHAVQLYRIEDDGTAVDIPFEYYNYTKCTIDIPE